MGQPLHQLAGNHQKIIKKTLPTKMKRFFKNLAEWAFAMYAVCNKHEATGNQFKLRAIVVPHNEWITLLNIVKIERQKQLDQLEFISKRPFGQEEEEIYTYCQHLKGIQERMKDAIKPI
jgi:hypothetical protein